MLLTYLSDEWIAAADTLLSAAEVDPPIEGEGFSIETVITGTPIGEARHIVELSGSSMRIHRPTGGESSTVRLTQTYEVAVGIATGAANAQSAFLNAEIQVSGDVSYLIENAGAVGTIGDVLKPLRDRTEFSANVPTKDA